MNGEIPSVPITTLAGVASLVDLLPEMPLPSPLPQTLGNKSLLFHPRVAEEAQRLLTVSDDNTLIPQLTHSLSLTSSRHIELKDPYNELPLDNPNAPTLLKGIILRRPDVFKIKNEQQPDWTNLYSQPQSCMESSSPHLGMNSVDLHGQHHPPAMMNNDPLHSMMQQSLDYISGMQSDDSIIKPVDQRGGHHPVLNFNCDGDIRTKKDNMHMQPHNMPPTMTDQLPIDPVYGKSTSNSSSTSSAPYPHGLPYTPLDTHGGQVLSSSKNHSSANTNHNYESPYHPGHEPVQSPTHPASSSSKQSINSSQQQPYPNASGTRAHLQQHNLHHVNSVNSVNSPNHLPISEYSSSGGVVDGSLYPNAHHAPNDTSKVNYTGALNHSESVPLVKLESYGKNAPVQEEAKPLKHSTIKELFIKLERTDSNQISIQKMSRPDPSSSASQHNPPNNNVVGRKATTTKNYCEESSEGEEEDEGAATGRRYNKPGKDKRRKRDSESDYVEAPEPKRRKNSISNTSEPEVTSYESPKKKIKRVERMLVPVLERLGSNILDNSTYHRFLKIMDVVLDVTDYHVDMELLDDDDIPSELLIPKSQLSELCSEAAKLKALGAMASMPTDRLVRLLSLLEKNIRDGCKVSPLADTEDNEDESKLWMELTMDRIARGVNSSLTALHILTSPNMPKRVYLEDLIDRVVIFTKFQLQNTIYPMYDPVYRIDRKGKDGFSSSKKKRAHARDVRDKKMISFYNKMHELVAHLAELLNVQILTDTTVLHLSTLGVSPFFVENISELQLSALKLVTAIFTQYEKHRRLLLDDILASIARLPSSKRSLRTFKLSTNSEECIQMLTALVLQLIQCVTYLPDKVAVTKAHLNAEAEDGTKEKVISVERDSLVSTKFETAVCTAGSFLTIFLSKCGSKSEDCDYRILFENFIQDLLSTVNKPEWPAAELLLSLLGNLLVKNLSNKGLEVSLRVASLEYLGQAAARLRKDTVSAQAKMETIDRIISDIKAEEESYGHFKEGENKEFESEEEKMEFLQRLLLDYLAVHGQSDPALMHARHFYIASWWKSAVTDIERSVKGPKTPKKNQKKKKKRGGGSSDEDSDIEEIDLDDEDETETEVNTKISHLTDHRKKFLLSKVRPFSDPLTSRKTEVVQTFVDYASAELLTRYLTSKRPFSASFDFFLTRILSVSMETTVAIRTRALKCLTMVVEADPTVLARNDMQMWVENSFLDQSTSVREAAVDLIGKYVLSCPDLIEKYYEKLSLRILDTGVSVRKRVIKILRDICIECPNFPKIPEICVKMIRRVNDEDGIRKLVMEVFQNMWFTSVREDPLDTERLLRKVSHITDVVASCANVGLDFFEQLLLSLFKPKDDKEDVREKVVNPEPPKAVVTASKQIVDCLVEHVLRNEENSSNSASSQRFVACVSTLFLFAKIRPQLLINHSITLEGYLSLKCQNISEVQAIANIASILELVVPLLMNPSDSFLAQLEEDCVKLIFKNDKSVIEACMACLGAVVNKITHNYNLVRDCFRKFHSVLLLQTKTMRDKPDDPRLEKSRPQLRRSVYTIGLFFRYFDFTEPKVYGDYPAEIVQQVFDELLYLLGRPCSDLQYLGIQAIGNLCVRHYDFMLGNELKAVYQRLLTSEAEIRLKVQALSNIQLYLTEEELRMIRQDAEWTKNAKLENIKEMGDVTSGMASTIVQIYLKQILEAFLHFDLNVRKAAVRVIQLVLQQGLVHPIQIVPYLICMSTDEEQGVAAAADKQLQEMEKKHPQFLQSQVLNGIRLSLQLQRILAGYKGPSLCMNQPLSIELPPCLEQDIPVVRGYRVRPKEAPSALNGFLYSLLRSTKPQRRAISLSLLKQFDDQNKTRLADLLYYADILAYFPYQVVDEPLFIIHHVDIVISVAGSNLLQSFKESLLPVNNPEESRESGEVNHSENGGGTEGSEKKIDIMDDDDDDVESLVSRIPEDTKTLEECIIASQGCLLLLMLKQHLKDMYGLTDTRISGYSPSDAAKTFERPVNRRNNPIFDPKCTLANLKCPPSGSTPEGRQALVEQYLHFKQLMLRIDPEEEGEEGEVKPVKIKIDQNLFTYAAKNKSSMEEQGNMGEGAAHGMVQQAPQNVNMPQHHHQQFAVISNPVVRVDRDPMVKVPKLTIVPLKFPGNEQGRRPSHKLKEHTPHKHKKSKHKKKKRHAVSTDDDSDNTESDPDFHL